LLHDETLGRHRTDATVTNDLSRLNDVFVLHMLVSLFLAVSPFFRQAFMILS